MSRAYAKPLEVDVNTSPTLIWLVLLISVIASVCVILLPVEPVVKFLACVLIALTTYFAIIKNNQYRQLIWHEDNRWTIKLSETDLNARLISDSYVSPWLTVLCFKTDANKSISVLIFPDAINPEQFRRLRGRLKIESAKLFSKIPDSM